MKLAITMCLHETYSWIRVGKHLSDIYPIRNSLKQQMLYRHLFSTLPANCMCLNLEVLIFMKLCEQNAIFMLYILWLMTLLQLESSHNPFQLSSIQTMQNHLCHT
jgi:hypothetical protein